MERELFFSAPLLSAKKVGREGGRDLKGFLFKKKLANFCSFVKQPFVRFRLDCFYFLEKWKFYFLFFKKGKLFLLLFAEFGK